MTGSAPVVSSVASITAPVRRTYVKPALDPAALLQHVMARGLVVADPAAAFRALATIGYYRLLIYMRALQAPRGKVFNPGATFEQLVTLYDFDRALRLLCMDGIERIEVALRASITHRVAVPHGPHFYEDAAFFVSTPWFKHGALLTKLDECESLGITHYQQTYGSPSRPPVWVVLEAATFGTLSRTYSGLLPVHQLSVARDFALPVAILVSWFRALSGLRNLCAHHGRLWNARILINAPKPAYKFAAQFDNVQTTHAHLVVVGALLQQVDPAAQLWTQKLRDLFHSYPSVAPSALGFPSRWESDPFWR